MSMCEILFLSLGIPAGTFTLLAVTYPIDYYVEKSRGKTEDFATGQWLLCVAGAVILLPPFFILINGRGCLG